MTLEKAIEQLGLEDRRSYPNRRLEGHIALKLLIEAGKRIQDGRAKSYDYFSHLLPGETEE